MFFWSKPYCPCDPASKEWVEMRLEWLFNQFPSNIFTDLPLILPTEEFFPFKYEPTAEYAQALLSLIAQYMGVTATRIKLKLHHDPNKFLFVNDRGDYVPGPQFAGTYSRSMHGHLIVLDTDELHSPVGLVSTMAHELSHLRLRGEGRVRRVKHDEELLTDLTAVFLGFGIFMANSQRAWIGHFTKWPGTDFNKPAYMSSPMYGYALAHLAWFEGNPKPPWRKYLNGESLPDFKDATNYLFRTCDSKFSPNLFADLNRGSKKVKNLVVLELTRG